MQTDNALKHDTHTTATLQPRDTFVFMRIFFLRFFNLCLFIFAFLFLMVLQASTENAASISEGMRRRNDAATTKKLSEMKLLTK